MTAISEKTSPTLADNYPSEAVNFYNQGNDKARQGNFGIAINFYTKAISYAAGFNLAYTNRGFAYFALKEYSKAISDCNYAIRLNPNDPEYISIWVIVCWPKIKRIKLWKISKNALTLPMTPLL
ncbi:hypothetical protein DhcVS_891 [Dehalococcoides mccartyi VS]|uniref:Uncharacterized protein n=1 Tax=Dehalococcoides mccartyi (strain VS) TaxID=311424 RepID=D2BI65_DEHMV|nr:tetratricopeptide repeat protein [Dehalococcoides mccartyi]ACZ62015.1 hypothetical protein DhcVS_891 [Dehalococcoides mccartyi VS]